MGRYERPRSLDEALALLSGGQWRLLAGGTDFYPAQGGRPLRDDVLDINGINCLRAISETQDEFVFGARATWTDIVRHELPAAFDALKAAAREVGSVQIQNAGTIAGNLCNASPAADGVPALMTMDARVEIANAAGRRLLPLDAFILGNRRTALDQGEIVTAIRVPRDAAAGRSHFVKLGARRYLVISIAMAAARIEVDSEGRIARAAVAVGACSPVAMRLPALETALRGHAADGTLADHVRPEHFSALSPIDDVRASAAYRREAAREIVLRAIGGALGDAGKRSIAA